VYYINHASLRDFYVSFYIIIAIQFPLYEKFKTDLSARARANNNGQTRPLNAMELITASAASKVAATAAAYPHEVVRVRLQAQRADDRHRYSGVKDACKTIWMTVSSSIYSITFIHTTPMHDMSININVADVCLNRRVLVAFIVVSQQH
jgi:hypothetical protein